MSKKGKSIPKHKSKKTKIPQTGLIVKDDINYFDLTPVFRFSNIDQNNWTISDWNSEELKDLMGTFFTMEQLPWKELLKHSGLRLKIIREINNPIHISPDE